MEVQSDFKELLALFNANEVEYLIVGGYALAFHGAPRFTGDMDLFVHSTPANAEHVLTALKAFGFEGLGLQAKDFQAPEVVIQLGVSPVRVDIITSIDGVSWEAAQKGESTGYYGDVPVSYIGRREFLINKRTSGRKKDLADIESLEKDENL